MHSVPKKGNAKEGSNCRTIALISFSSEVTLKFLQQIFLPYMEFRNVSCSKWISKRKMHQRSYCKYPSAIGGAYHRISEENHAVSYDTLKPSTMWIIKTYQLLYCIPKEMGVSQHLNVMTCILMSEPNKVTQFPPGVQQRFIDLLGKVYDSADTIPVKG